MLIDCLGTTEEFATLFADRSVLEAMLRFESALARSQARLGMIAQKDADAIAAVAAENFDAGTIASQARGSASVAIPFVQTLKAQAATEFAHWGSTSQDLLDTALILLLAKAQDLLKRDHERLTAALKKLSHEHQATVMLARTLMQPAAPLTFGYKVALWYGGLARAGRRLWRSFDDALLVQFGGAAGTLAAFGARGPALAAEVARELSLTVAPPWHTERDRLAAVVSNLGIYLGGLAKIARDIELLMQFEVAELSEAGGGSSAMPHKRNPSGCVVALAAAARVPALVAAYLGSMVQEHERAAGPWQSEWQTVAEIVSSTGSALAALVGVLETLRVDSERMQANLEATYGIVLSEKAATLEKPQRVAEAAKQALKSRQPLAEILKINLGTPEDYLGSSEVFRRKLLEDME